MERPQEVVRMLLHLRWLSPERGCNPVTKYFFMEKMLSTIQLTEMQAEKLLDKYYKEHVNYSVPLGRRQDPDSGYECASLRESNCKILKQMLTAPVGTEFTVEWKWGKIKHYNCTTICAGNLALIGYRDETMHHIHIVKMFLRATSFHWFRQKYPIK